MTESINNQPEALDGDLTGSIAYPGTEYLEGAKTSQKDTQRLLAVFPRTVS